MCTREPRLVLVSLLIGWKNGARTLNQSLSEVIINQTNSLITFDTQLKNTLNTSKTNWVVQWIALSTLRTTGAWWLSAREPMIFLALAHILSSLLLASRLCKNYICCVNVIKLREKKCKWWKLLKEVEVFLTDTQFDFLQVNRIKMWKCKDFFLSYSLSSA